MVRMKFSIQYHAAIRKKLKIDRGLPGRTRTPSTARPRDRFTYCNLISIFPTRLSTRHRLDSLTCHHVYNDECARRVRAERAARSPYKILSSLNSSPFCTVLLPRLLQRIATISGLHPAQLLLACSYTYHTQ